MIAKRVRLRVVDHLGTYGSIILPCDMGVDDAQANDFMELYNVTTNVAMRELDIIRVVERHTDPATSGPTSLINDVAVLTFKSNGPFGLKVPILGPLESIFYPDDVTIDPDEPFVAALIAFIIAVGKDRAGNAITGYLQGKRVGAGGP